MTFDWHTDWPKIREKVYQRLEKQLAYREDGGVDAYLDGFEDRHPRRSFDEPTVLTGERYPAQVTHIADCGGLLEFEFEIRGGQFAGHTIYGNADADPWSGSEAEEWCESIMDRLPAAGERLDLDDLVGIRCEIEVDEWPGAIEDTARIRAVYRGSAEDPVVQEMEMQEAAARRMREDPFGQPR